ncbi:MAG: NUDIX domain-containing protein [Pseudomonadota bacterium]
MIDDAIPAATILLLRDEPAFEVLMIERHANIKFAGGAMVFPGGRIDSADSDPRWRDHCAGVKIVDANQIVPRIAAIREAYEETGILFARSDDGSMLSGDGAAKFNHERGIVEQDAARFFELVRDNKLILAIEALHLYARWAPPKAAQHRRYDTWFFAAKAPSGQIAVEDGNEATASTWTTPDAVLKSFAAGECKMIFPTVRNLELLNRSHSASDVFSLAAERKIEKVEPWVIERDGKHIICIPSDLGYPVTEELLETAFRS